MFGRGHYNIPGATARAIGPFHFSGPQLGEAAPEALLAGAGRYGSRQGPLQAGSDCAGARLGVLRSGRRGRHRTLRGL
jgi:hypothetical protein